MHVDGFLNLDSGTRRCTVPLLPYKTYVVSPQVSTTYQNPSRYHKGWEGPLHRGFVVSKNSRTLLCLLESFSTWTFPEHGLVLPSTVSVPGYLLVSKLPLGRREGPVLHLTGVTLDQPYRQEREEWETEGRVYVGTYVTN